MSLETMHPGEELLVQVREDTYPATLLARRGQQALVELRAPNGITALRCLDLHSSGYRHPRGRFHSYWTLSLAWLEAIVEAGTSWIGHPQSGEQRLFPVPTPTILVQQRRFGQAFHDFWQKAPGPRLLRRLQTCDDAYWVRGWTRGGCSVCAAALRLWCQHSQECETIKAEANMVVLAGTHEQTHVVLALQYEGASLFVDSTGFWTLEALLFRWRHLHPVRLEAPSPDNVKDIPCDLIVIGQVANQLCQRLGPLPCSMLFPEGVSALVYAIEPLPRLDHDPHE